ncbi:hypothetical protein SASPL_141018 [Salvia splendens]|uniref:Alpha-1,6-mannosyl-glycoprotein 2-beta-N-acetylglucosaminyltransferase n=1 Tax=Salvia splendens TaxID=180675 RepID=A0A8X8ZBW8_SALSN|nr:hypothetical protein SASPL_141018 [Salvia splendens]
MREIFLCRFSGDTENNQLARANTIADLITIYSANESFGSNCNHCFNSSKNSKLPRQNELSISLQKRNQMLPRNLDLYPKLGHNHIVIVLYVHNHPQYLRVAVDSLSKVEGISETLLVVSHDGYFHEMNKVVEGIMFCQVKQIFAPFSPHVFPEGFPGVSSSDCRDKDDAVAKKCVGTPDQYGNHRLPKIVSLKHHWWWMMNTVWDGLEETRHHSGHILFIEEDDFIFPNAYRNLQLLVKLKPKKCPDCYAANLAPSEVKSKGEGWGSLITERMGNVGYSFNRTVWRMIHRKAVEFCSFDDYNWDITMWATVYPSFGSPVYSLRAPRTSAVHVVCIKLLISNRIGGCTCTSINPAIKPGLGDGEAGEIKGTVNYVWNSPNCIGLQRAKSMHETEKEMKSKYEGVSLGNHKFIDYNASVVVEKDEKHFVEKCGGGVERKLDVDSSLLGRNLGEIRVGGDGLSKGICVGVDRSSEIESESSESGEESEGSGDHRVHTGKGEGSSEEKEREGEGTGDGDGEVMADHYAIISKVMGELLESELKHEKSEGDSCDSEGGNVEDRREDDKEGEGEGLASGSESLSPDDALIGDIIPTRRLHPLLDEDAPQPAQIIVSADETDIQESEAVDDEDDDDNTEDHTKSVITWTEEDQKNLMEVGNSEIERNQRLERILTRRRNRSMIPEINLMELENSDFQFQVAPISTARLNPFDLPQDSVPGSAPSVLSQRSKNPSELPDDLIEEDLKEMGGESRVEIKPSLTRQPFLRRRVNFSAMPSIFSPNMLERRPVAIADESGYSPYKRQASRKSSSSEETESVGSVENFEDEAEEDPEDDHEPVSNDEDSADTRGPVDDVPNRGPVYDTDTSPTAAARLDVEHPDDERIQILRLLIKKNALSNAALLLKTVVRKAERLDFLRFHMEIGLTWPLCATDDDLLLSEANWKVPEIGECDCCACKNYGQKGGEFLVESEEGSKMLNEMPEKSSHHRGKHHSCLNHGRHHGADVVEVAALAEETLSNVPQTLSSVCGPNQKDCRKIYKIQKPNSKKAEACTNMCTSTCIRGGFGSPGEGPLNIRRRAVERFNHDADFRFLHNCISDLFVDWLRSDMEMLKLGKLNRISLAAKWCPSLYSSFDRITLLCKTIAKKVFLVAEFPEYESMEEAYYAYRVRDRLRKALQLRKALCRCGRRCSCRRFTSAPTIGDLYLTTESLPWR